MATDTSTVDAAAVRGAVLVATLVAFLLAVVMALMQFVGDLGLILAHSGSLSHTGGLVAGLIERPSAWFHPIEKPPFVSTVYPPVFLALAHGAWQLTGGDVFVVGRVVGLLANLGATGLIVLLAYEDRVVPAMVAGALYFFSPLVSGVPVQLHVDGLAVALGLGALYWFRRSEGRRALVGAAALSVLAIYTKQNLAVIPVAIACALAIDGQGRRVGEFAGMVGAGGLGVLGVLQAVTSGDAVAHLLVHSTAFDWYPGAALQLTGWVVLGHFGIAALAIAGASLRSSRDPRVSVFPIAGLFAFEIALFTAAKEGAWGGYFLPAWAVGAVMAGWALNHAWPTRAALRGEVSWYRVALGALVVLLAAGQLGMHLTWHPTGPYDREAQAAAAAHIEGAPGPVLSAEQGLVVQTDQAELYDALMMRALARGGVWDQCHLTERIATQRYSYIVLRIDAQQARAWRGSRWTESMIRSIRRHYRLEAIHGGYYVYAPRPSETDTGGHHES